MGYNTDFSGTLQFTKELTASQLATLNKMLGEDCRDHPEWGVKDLYYIDLELTEDFTGIKWNEAEKTYDLDQLVNVVIREMRKICPDFGLSGTLLAQGESINDRWALTIASDGFAVKRPIAIKGKVVECPHCGEHFELEEL